MGDLVGVELTVGDLLGEAGELVMVGAGVGAEGGEGLVDAQLPAFGEDALDLFQDDAASSQGVLELAAFEFAGGQGALLQNRDGRQVRECLGELDVLSGR